MSYVINLTDGTIFAVIPDGTVNTESSMTLIGQNYDDYGRFINENYIHLLENSSDDTAPGDPLVGQLWWDKGNKILKIYDGTNFKSLAASVANTVAPTNSVIGDFWYDTAQQQVKVYTGSSWFVVGPSYSTDSGITGAIVDTITDNTSGTHIVVKLMVDDTLVGIISKDPEFTPSTVVSGFSTIKPGIQLAATLSGQTPLFQGTATNSQLLNSLSSSDFLRKNVNQSTTGTLAVANDSGVTIGASGTFKASVSGNDVVIENQVNNGNVLVKSIVGGTPTTTMNVNGFTGRITVVGVPPGSNDNTIATTSFVNSQLASGIPSGVIMMWSGNVASIPAGFYLCNGSNGTPDLRNRFVIGAGGSYAVGATGGATSVTLSESNLPSHTHSVSANGTTSSALSTHGHGVNGTSTGQSQSHTHSVSISASLTDPGHVHIMPGDDQLSFASGGTWPGTSVGSFGYDASSGSGGGGQYWQTSSATTGATVSATASAGNASVDHTHNINVITSTVDLAHDHTWSYSGNTSSVGSGQSFSILPSYYALCYIMKG